MKYLKGFFVYIVGRGNLSIQLNLCSIMILLEFELLSFVNTILNDLVTPLLKYHYSALITPQEGNQ